MNLKQAIREAGHTGKSWAATQGITPVYVSVMNKKGAIVVYGVVYTKTKFTVSKK